MKKFALFTALAVLGSACTAGSPAEDEPIEGLEEAISWSCNSVSGLMPTKASLAVAMANELKRWEPLTDLTIGNVNWLPQVILSPAGVSRCSAMGSSCANTKALLALQDWAVNDVISQNIFNATNYRQDLMASFARQSDHINNLRWNAPWKLPQPHNLAKVGGPTNLGIGACGPHWVFKPTTPSGGTYANPSNLVNNLYFFGEPWNDFLAFTVTNGNVAIDPIDGDNSSAVTTTGSCPTYELDRTYNPSGALLGKCCVTVSGQNGALLAVPRALGYVGCKAGAIPTR